MTNLTTLSTLTNEADGLEAIIFDDPEVARIRVVCRDTDADETFSVIWTLDIASAVKKARAFAFGEAE